MEPRLILRIRPLLKVVKLGGRFEQKGFTGQAFLFAQQVKEFAEELPLSNEQSGLTIVVEKLDNVNGIKDYQSQLVEQIGVASFEGDQLNKSNLEESDDGIISIILLMPNNIPVLDITEIICQNIHDNGTVLTVCEIQRKIASPISDFMKGRAEEVKLFPDGKMS
ncbi:hypothetical protein ABEB36_015670 [Hypothenemus hampei]|uniref:Uncharacterized protein n=1 Tax=Hypothenemus hampei TaxID=57062 RepID=A0ABD1DZF5_HYPHA